MANSTHSEKKVSRVALASKVGEKTYFLMATRPPGSKREPNKLSMIGGTNPPVTSLQDAAIQHVKNEIGLELAPSDLQYISSWITNELTADGESIDWYTTVFVVYLAEMTEFSDLQGFQGESRKIAWYDFDELDATMVAFNEYQMLQAVLAADFSEAE